MVGRRGLAAPILHKGAGHLARMSACGDKSALRGRIALPGGMEEAAFHSLRRTWNGMFQGRTGTEIPSHMKRWAGRPLSLREDEEEAFS